MVAFAGAALLLAAIALYGVLSALVGERAKEIAIRTALGARPTAATGVVLLRAGRLTAVGIVAGSAAAFAAAHAGANLLYGVAPGDPGTFALVAIVIAGCASIATWLPARRAASVDPMLVLRDE